MPLGNEPTQPGDIPTNPIAPPPEQPAPSKSKWPLIVTVVVAVLIAAALGVYFLAMKPVEQSPSNSSQSSKNDKDTSTVTSITTTNSPNHENGTIAFTHPDSWDVTKETDQYGTEHTTIKSPLGNAVDMYLRDSVGGTCEDDNDTYIVVKKITTQSPAYIFSEYRVPASWGSQALRLERDYNQKTATHKALTDGQSNTNLCKNLFGYSIAKDINITIKNSSGMEASYDNIKDDTAFITMLQSFEVTDN